VLASVWIVTRAGKANEIRDHLGILDTKDRYFQPRRLQAAAPISARDQSRQSGCLQYRNRQLKVAIEGERHEAQS
jgi:hypothetical protein